METSRFIYQKLEAFIKKFYTNKLIRGIIFFIGLGLLYFIVTLFVEYFLWLKPLGRQFLFWTFIAVEGFLLLRFILFPCFKLFKLQKGINYNQASAIIGNHFTEVSDKLTNFLQLSDGDFSNQKSELLLASIEQKANSLQPIPFGNAINFKNNQKYIPLACIPILFFAVFYATGNSKIISQSLNRVVHYNSAFLPPAPFTFVVLNPTLQTEQNKDFFLRIKSQGKVVPENVMLFIGDESYYMESTKAGEFQFKIVKPVSNVTFHLEANAILSADYELKVIPVPSIANFEMHLHFPAYLNKKQETIKGSGNAIIPEGTRVTWKINTEATQKVDFKDERTVLPFSKANNIFVLTKNIAQNTDYQILTSNSSVQNYEKLNYQLSVIKDQFPSITVNQAPDSLKVEKNYVLGQVSDDYGLSKLQVVYYEKDKPQTAKRAIIAIKNAAFDQFVFAFPSNLPVQEGVSYEYYFEVFDTDAIHGFKHSRSSVFSNRVATVEEKQDQLLQQQNDNISGMQKSLKKQDKQIAAIDQLTKTGKEKDNLEFKDQQKVSDFIKQQEQQDNLMKDFANKMKSNMDKTKAKDATKELLEKRLEEATKELAKNEKLLNELKDLNDKIKSEELQDKLEKFKQNSKNQVKTLQQLVELTKRYYVDKKAEQLADKLDKLSEKQKQLSDNDKENSTNKQEEINESFDKIQEELQDLDKENKDLKAPLDIPNDTAKQKSIDDDLNKAKEELQKNDKSKAKPKQKSASSKMKEMGGKIKESMESGEREQLEEDVKMLRQILDNLLAFSVSQEEVMSQFKSLKSGSPAFNKNIKSQQTLKLQFKHVDDSLFAMSLRNPKIADQVTKEIGNVNYNVDKAIETLSNAQIPKGMSHQQYAVSGANKLADFLSELLNSMQMDLSGSGQGKPKPGQGSGMQLPDIIAKQKGLGDKMKDGMDKGEKPGTGKEGKPSQEGQSGKDGKDGKSGAGSGKSGSNGKEGKDGEGDAKAIMEIYKEQKQLREALEMELNKQGLGGNGQNALEQMKQIEKQLLNKGFKNETLQKILNVNQELLKLKTAIQQQGEEEKRQSETNKKEFNNESDSLPKSLLEYLNSIEILNRQSLPLRSNFNKKVQIYFNKK
ncbi:DUF4175 family protein [Flavobacterium restrictum]|uniref:DUF4175 family protein n=1 Tax=Flavobacterium restrictum TaxID=2594428 RepID=A0A553E5N4_9FLAO|nr:DUF4175 family protein [Flavobacterium restrictum]TRX40366.1 hypothetical protein FNW21_06450 [Flavobacterium restrictum]